MAYDDALKAGALAFFGDKYGDVVRVVRMGDFSIELCGGTHVGAPAISGCSSSKAKSGVAAGVRRIEAFTGQGALEAIRRREQILEDIGGHLGARDGAALERLERLLAREKELEKKLRALEQKLVAGDGAAGGADAEKVREANGVKVVTRKVEGVEARALREMADRMRQKYGSAVVALGSDSATTRSRCWSQSRPTWPAGSRPAISSSRSLRLSAAPAADGRTSRRRAAATPRSLDEALERIAALVA